MTTATVERRPKSFDPAALFAEAMALHQAGRLADVERLYNQARVTALGIRRCGHFARGTLCLRALAPRLRDQSDARTISSARADVVLGKLTAAEA